MAGRTVRWTMAVALAFGTILVGPSAAPAAGSELRVIAWNLCGEAGGSRGDEGYCPYRNEPEVKIDQIGQLVDEHDANVVLLQEVCGDEAGSHLDLLQARLGPEWQIRRANGARPDGRIDCRGVLTGNLGLGIAVKATVTETTVAQTLPPDSTGVSKQTLPTLCVRTSAWQTRICTTHVLADPDDPRRPQQVRNIADHIRTDRGNVVLGGDFNIFPGAAQLQPIADILDECDGRAYRLGDIVNEDTHRAWTTDNAHVFRKRDHIFAAKTTTGSVFSACDTDRDRMDTTPNEADSGPPHGYSDHAPVIGYLRSTP